jgi:hypothetical protein
LFFEMVGLNISAGMVNDVQCDEEAELGWLDGISIRSINELWVGIMDLTLNEKATTLSAVVVLGSSGSHLPLRASEQ